jgi:hypothetical protein
MPMLYGFLGHGTWAGGLGLDLAARAWAAARAMGHTAWAWAAAWDGHQGVFSEVHVSDSN